MIEAGAPAIAAMQGGGSYNRNSALQRANLASALPLLEAAAGTLAATGRRTITIADYGCSQGRSAMRPIGTAIDALRRRAGFTGAIEVFHTDLPTNDFGSLFATLAGRESYLEGRGGIFPAAIGRSYFDPILPPERVDLGWSSNALHWLSGNPIEVADHGWAVFSGSAEARPAVDRHLAADWSRFLAARAVEMRRGARLVLQFLAHGPDSHGFEWMAGAFWRSIEDVAHAQGITDAELRRMTCPSAGRTLAAIEAPFAGDRGDGLILTHCSLVEARDPYWDVYRDTGDAAALGGNWAAMMRAANGPNFAAGLDPHRDADAFLDAVSDRLAQRIADAPQRSRSFNALLVIEKGSPSA